jgi:CO/xanthine dehydrogenase FAD-binding subunit
MKLPPFELHTPTELEEIFELLEAHGPSVRLMAGGTDLLPRLKSRRIEAQHLVTLKGIGALGGLAFDQQEGLSIGATVLLSEVAALPETRELYPALFSAISRLATVQVRNKATVAGNLCNASPCADTATPLLAYGARVVLAGPDGRREVPLEEFFRGPGETAVGDREVLERIVVPPPEAGLRSLFVKFSPRSRVDIAAVNMTLALRLESGQVERIDILLGTVAPTPMRAVGAEAVLRGEPLTPEGMERAALAARDECQPITDFRATAEYKTRLVYVLTRRGLETLSEMV